MVQFKNLIFVWASDLKIPYPTPQWWVGRHTLASAREEWLAHEGFDGELPWPEPMAGQKRFASGTQWGGGGAGSFWGVKSRAMGGGRRKVSMPVPFTQFRRGPAGRGVASRARPPAFLTKNSGELKGMDTNMTLAGPVIATTTTNTDSFTLNLVEPGNGSYNRIGRKIFNKTLRISGGLAYQTDQDPTTGNASGATLRMVVVWDKQPSGTLPVFSEIFGRTSQDGTETTSVFDNLRFDNTARFQVLRDKYIDGQPNTGGDAGTANLMAYHYYCDEFIDLKNRTTVFSGDSDPVTIADISSGALYVFFRADGATADVRDWSVESSMSARLRFTS